jgi:hypothetical protein
MSEGREGDTLGGPNEMPMPARTRGVLRAFCKSRSAGDRLLLGFREVSPGPSRLTSVQSMQNPDPELFEGWWHANIQSILMDCLQADNPFQETMGKNYALSAAVSYNPNFV